MSSRNSLNRPLPTQRVSSKKFTYGWDTHVIRGMRNKPFKIIRKSDGKILGRFVWHDRWLPVK